MKLSTLVATRLAHLRTERMDRAAVERQQLTKFRRLVRHAERRSPYYREIIADARIDLDTCVPADFPELTKEDVVRNFDRMVTDPRLTLERLNRFLSASTDGAELYGGEYAVLHTSGTWGVPAVFVYSRADWTRGLAHALRINPPQLRKRRMAFVGATTGHFAGVGFAASSQHGLLKLLYDMEMYNVKEPLGPSVDRLNRFQPDILAGYPSALGRLADRQRRGQLDIRPTWVQSSGEQVLDADRAVIESAFGVPLINVYSCSEHLIMGFGGSAAGGIYLLEDDLHFEPLPDRTLITNLFNYTLPLIRYRMSDVLVDAPDPAPRYPFRKVRELGGRSAAPRFQNARGEVQLMHPSMIENITPEGVRRHQLVVHDATSCTLLVQLGDGLADAARLRVLDEVRAALRAALASLDLGNVSSTVREVDDLGPDARTAKFRPIVTPETPRAG